MIMKLRQASATTTALRISCKLPNMPPNMSPGIYPLAVASCNMDISAVEI